MQFLISCIHYLFEVPICKNGDEIVFAAQTEELFAYVKHEEAEDFGEPQKVQIDMPSNSTEIAGVSVRNIGDEVWIAVIMKTVIGEEAYNLHVYSSFSVRNDISTTFEFLSDK